MAPGPPAKSRAAWFVGRNSLRAPKTRTRDHFLFSPRLRNASGAIIHRTDVSVLWFIFFCVGLQRCRLVLLRLTVASGIASPTTMAIAPDGRIFVCSQSGVLRVIKNGVLLATPFVTLSVDSRGRE